MGQSKLFILQQRTVSLITFYNQIRNSIKILYVFVIFNISFCGLIVSKPLSDRLPDVIFHQKSIFPRRLSFLRPITTYFSVYNSSKKVTQGSQAALISPFLIEKSTLCQRFSFPIRNAKR